jgi:hypothetical protein
LIDFWCFTPLSAIFQLYHGKKQPVLVVKEAREPPILGKQLVKFIT